MKKLLIPTLLATCMAPLTCLANLTSCSIKQTPLYFEDVLNDGQNAIIGYTTTGELDIDIEYKFENSEWQDWDGSKITLKNGQRLYVRNTKDTLSNPSLYFSFNTEGGLVTANGNVNSLINYQQLTPYCFNYLFANCKTLIQPPKLPARTLAEGCYANMFTRSGLITAPQLPAKEMTKYCYCAMFSDCPGIKVAPELNSTSLAPHCYEQMFDICGLTEAPQLPAEELADYCYSFMFCHCPITKMPPLPSTHLADHCYYGMFQNCRQLVYATDVLPAVQLTNNCYDHMFAYCGELITAPRIVGNRYAASCFLKMFADCTKLTIVEDDLTNKQLICSFGSGLSDKLYEEMFRGCVHVDWDDDTTNGTPAWEHSYSYA